MKRNIFGAAVLATGLALGFTAQAQTPAKKPNILVIMGDDIGWSNLGSYHQGLMLNATPNLDRLATEGMRFTDYYAESSCTAGRANFITGELPIRTGLTTVGQAAPRSACRRRRRPWPRHSSQWVMPRGNSARITSVIATSSCRRFHELRRVFRLPLPSQSAMEDPFYSTYPEGMEGYGRAACNLVHS